MNCVYLMAPCACGYLMRATLVETDRHPIRMDPEERRGDLMIQSDFKEASGTRNHTEGHHTLAQTAQRREVFTKEGVFSLRETVTSLL